MILEAGSLVPADGRLLEVYGLTMNESSLTGESLSAEKHTGCLRTEGERLSPGDQVNMVFSAWTIFPVIWRLALWESVFWFLDSVFTGRNLYWTR